MASHETEEKSDLNIGLVGLAIGLVWIAIVAAFSYWLAI
jgi:hypothetical protein